MSLRILAFDTSTAVCSVALIIDNTVSLSVGMDKFQYEKEILFMIDSLLLEAGITLQSLDLLVCCCGPGSFVGVRIGVGIAQGLSLGSGLPLVALSSLEILAQGTWRLMKSRRVLATVNAKLGALYLACYYYRGKGIWLRKGTELLLTPMDMSILISKLNGKWVLTGTGWEEYPVLLSKSIFQISVRKVLFPSARDMLLLAIQRWKNGNLITVNEVQPIYLDKL